MTHRDCLSMAVLAAMPLGPVAAAVDFAAVSISPSPDVLVRFDAADPGAGGPELATLAGNFVRGVVLTAPATGWYLATDSSGGTPTGLFRLEGGASTQVAEMPYTSALPGGLTFNPDASGLFAAFGGPDDVSSRLYRVSFGGEFTLVGRINILGVDTQIAGIAIDMSDGVLYGFDNHTDALVLIDTQTAEATIVGSGLGIATFGSGGLAFPAGRTDSLYLSTAGGSIYRVDQYGGAVVESLGSLPFTATAIAAVPEPAPCPGDADGNRVVGQNDIELALFHYLENVPPGTLGDVDDNGVVNGDDLDLILFNYGLVCPP